MTYVLVVDDDADSRQSLCRMIEQVGMTVRSANSGTEAITMIENEAPLMVFLHLLTLNGDGLDVLMSLRAKAATKAIPIAMVSSFTKAEQELLAVPEVRTLIQREGMTVSDLVGMLQPDKRMSRQAAMN